MFVLLFITIIMKALECKTLGVMATPLLHVQLHEYTLQPIIFIVHAHIHVETLSHYARVAEKACTYTDKLHRRQNG